MQHLRTRAAAAMNVMGPLSAAHAELDNLRMLTAMIDTPTQRAESAFRLALITE